MGRKSKTSVMMMTPQADHLVEVREAMDWTTDIPPDPGELEDPDLADIELSEDENQTNTIEVMRKFPLTLSVTRF